MSNPSIFSTEMIYLFSLGFGFLFLSPKHSKNKSLFVYILRFDIRVIRFTYFNFQNVMNVFQFSHNTYLKKCALMTKVVNQCLHCQVVFILLLKSLNSFFYS